MTKAKNLLEFKKNLGEELKVVEGIPGSEKIKKQYKTALFREIVSDPEYQQLKHEYLNEKRTEKSKEKIFQEAFSHAQKLNPSLTEESFRDLIMGKTEKKESKETLTKSLEFEKDTFKIDSTGWKEEKRDVYGKGKMKVKVNATGDVVEYLEGKAKGEQIFITYDAFIREVMKAKNCSKEVVENKYLMTVDELEEKMKDKPNGSEKYNKFFNDEVNSHLAGCWNPSYKKFYSIGERSCIWLVGGVNAGFDEFKWNQYDYSRDYGFGGRLLKN